MFLSELKDGQIGVISTLNYDAAFRRRLMDMGFCPGEQVQRLAAGIGGSTVLYRVKDSMVALRRRDAAKMGVRM